MAEGYFRQMVKEKNLSIEVGSAGLGAGNGQPPSRNSVLAMDEEGIDISTIRSRSFTPEMADTYTHIFAMGPGHVSTIQSYFPEYTEKTFLLREFIAEGFDSSVPDPIGGDLDEYRYARNLIKEAMPSVLHHVLLSSTDGKG